MKNRLKTRKPKSGEIFCSIQDLFEIKDKKRFIAFTAIIGFVVAYVLFLVSQQVMPSNWVYSETFEENWMKPEFNATHWKPIQLPFFELGKERVLVYYRGEVELLGITKPNIVIGAEERIVGVYINGREVTSYKTLGTGIILDQSLFKPGKNLLAVKGSGGYYRTIGVSTPKTTIGDSKILLLFLLTPALLFFILDRKTLDSNKTALIVFLVLTLIFLKPIFQDFNYWGTFDWDVNEGSNAIQRETILQFHQIPLWDPYSSGEPMLAQPWSTWMSPLFPVILVFNVIAGLKIQIILCYVIGLFGMYLLGKHLKLNTYAIYLMAFTFMFSSWYSLRISVGSQVPPPLSLLPWAFLFYLKALEDKKYAVLSAIMMAFVMFHGGIYVLVYIAMFLTLYSVVTSAKNLFENKSKKDIINPLITLIVVGILCSALSAVKALPMIELSMEYPRLTEQDPYDTLYRGYTLKYLYYAFLGTAQMKYNPDLNDNVWDGMGAYIGPIALLLAAGGILFYFRKQWPLVLIILFGILLSFGSSRSEMVLWNMLDKLPIFSSLRHPSRLLIIAFFPITIFAGYMASKIENKKRWIALAITVLVFYNLTAIDSPTLSQAFTISPRTITETRFTQVIARPQQIFVYSESYLHFLQNQGVVNRYASLAALSGVKSSAHSVEDPKYRGEVYLESDKGNASFKSFSPNRMVVEVNSESQDTLMINQNYDKWWKTSGKEVYSKEGLIAVNVSKTDKEIVLYYSPTSFKIGLMITLLTILLIAHYHFIGKEKQNLKKYLKTLKNRRLIIYAILILLISTYGVDFIQASGLYSEKEVLINGSEYKILNTIKSGTWMASDLGHDLGHKADDGSWQSEKNGYGYLISGPYVNIQEGAYEVTFRIKIDDNKIQDSKVVSIEIARNRGTTIISKELYIKDFKESNKYQDFTLTISTQRPLADVEFRAHYAGSPVIVNIERVTLTPIG